MRSLLLLLLFLVLSSCSPRPSEPAPVIPAPGPMRDSLDYHRGRYNRVYSDPNQTTFADRPSEFLVECLRSLPAPRHPKPRALDLGAGNGRNSFAAADAGFSVTAIDIAPAGLTHIRSIAAARHYDIQTLEADAYAAHYQPDSLDLLIAIYFNIPADLAQRLEAAVKPGGAIIVEGFPSQTGEDLLRREFAGWKILKCQTVDAIPDWTWGREAKPAPVLRFFARKAGR